MAKGCFERRCEGKNLTFAHQTHARIVPDLQLNNS